MSLEEKLTKIKQETETQGSGFDWNRRREQWVNKFDELLQSAEVYFSPLAEKNLVKLVRYQLTINEENIGIYNIPGLRILINRFEFLIEPMGTLLIGAYGRADLVFYNKNQNVMLVLTGDSFESSTWKIVNSKSPLVVEEFSMQKIESIIEKWLDI